MRTILFTLTFTFLWLAPHMAKARVSSERLVEETKERTRAKLEPLLRRLCADSCDIVDIYVDVQEKLSDGADMGFEPAFEGVRKQEFEVKKLTIDLQIDSRITEENKSRLERIINLNLKSISRNLDIIWSQIMVPRIGTGQGHVETLEDELSMRIRQALNKIIEQYCPNQCILEQINVTGERVTIDQSRSIPKNRIMTSASADMFLRVDQVDIDMTMDDSLSEKERARIAAVMKAKTRFIEPVDLNISVTAFPETYLEKKNRMEKQADDPYGLEKLRQMLIMFRDLAGTKEIITNTNSKTSSETSSNSLSETNNSSKDTNTSRRSDVNSQFSEESLTTEEIAAYAAGFILLMTLVAIILMKVSRANRAANEMVSGSPSFIGGLPYTRGFDKEGDEHGDKGGGDLVPSADGGAAPKSAIQLSLKLRLLKEELNKLFMEQPKVAKDTFTRLIREEGVEFTAKYVKILGHVVIYELLQDPTLQRDLYELSEYYHRSNLSFTRDEEYTLLTKLKTKVTASEIRVLTQKSSEKFAFLTTLDAGQIYNLISEEKMQVQSIVLTQLGRKKRASVFELYQGDAKVKLLAELSSADAIPKEYLINVAQALHKKVKSRPEFDTENLRSSDILLDLLEKSNLSEQKTLMLTLVEKNPDTARSLKMKLVTVEILPYLKDGHLLEMILGMEREALLIFLSGCPDHIRDLFINKAPEELADSWLEDLANISSIEEASYRMAEMKIISRIRNLANNGVISLLEINEMIFADPKGMQSQEETTVLNKDSSSGAFAA